MIKILAIGRIPALVLALSLAIPGRAAALDFEEGSWRLIDEYRKSTAGIKDLPVSSGMIVFDYVDIGDDQEPLLGGSTAGLGRYLRNIVVDELTGHGFTVVDQGRLADAMRRVGFTVEDIYRDDRVLRLMDEFPGVGGIVSGNITSSGNPALLDVETTLRRRERGGLAPLVGLSTVVADSNADAVIGVNVPPLSDNRPNLILAGHPFLDAAAPYRMEIIGVNGAKEFRYRNSRVYVAGEKGERFVIRLFNHSRRPVAVALFVDAVPVNMPSPAAEFAGKAAILPSKAKKILVPPGTALDIKGWRGEDGSTTPFLFADAADSGSMGRMFWDSIGMVSAAFFDTKDGVRSMWDVTTGEDGWLLKEIPDKGAESTVSSVIDEDGRERELRHAATPAVMLSVHYDIPRRVGNYSLVQGGK